MILIYSQHITNRLKYILDFLFNKYDSLHFTLTSNKTEFINNNGIKINYSEDCIVGALKVVPSGFLYENKLINFVPEISDSSWGKVIFKTADNEQIPFDIFSASFYFISRYEEYLPFTPDKFNRFCYTSSLAFKAGMLDKPIVDIWFNKLLNSIITKNDEVIKNHKKVNFISTLDIDNAFAFKGKGLIRTVGGFSKSLFKFKINENKNRLAVLLNKKDDPYNTYNYIENIHKKYNIIPKIFVLTSKYGRYDKNLNPKTNLFVNTVNKINNFADIGIHPSFSSNNSNTLLAEKAILENIIKKEIKISRQHFLIIKFPETYNKLQNAGITEDYSLGYSNFIGYRAGTSNSFHFFDLTKNIETDLKIFPFAVMDRALNSFLKFEPANAISTISQHIEMSKENYGNFVSLWHNESLCNINEWSEWNKVYEQIFEVIK